MGNCKCNCNSESTHGINVPAMFACRQSVPDILCALGSTINNIQSCFKPEVVAMMNHLSCCGFAVDTDKNKMWYNGVQYELSRSSDCVKSVCVSNVEIIQQPTYEEIAADRDTPAIPQFAYKYDVTYVYADGSCNQVTGVSTGGIAIFNSKGSYSCTIDGVLDIKPNYTGNDKVTVVSGYLEIHGIKVQFEPAIVRQPSKEIVYTYQYDNIEAKAKVTMANGEEVSVVDGVMTIPSTGGQVLLSCYHDAVDTDGKVVAVDGAVQKKYHVEGNAVVTETVNDLPTIFYYVTADGVMEPIASAIFNITSNDLTSDVIHHFKMVVTNPEADDVHRQYEEDFYINQLGSEEIISYANPTITVSPEVDTNLSSVGGDVTYEVSEITIDKVTKVNGVVTNTTTLRLTDNTLENTNWVWSFDDTPDTGSVNQKSYTKTISANTVVDSKSHTVKVIASICGESLVESRTINVAGKSEYSTSYELPKLTVTPTDNKSLSKAGGNVTYTISDIQIDKVTYLNGEESNRDTLKLSNGTLTTATWSWYYDGTKVDNKDNQTTFTTNVAANTTANNIEHTVEVKGSVYGKPLNATRNVTVLGEATSVTWGDIEIRNFSPTTIEKAYASFGSKDYVTQNLTFDVYQQRTTVTTSGGNSSTNTESIKLNSNEYNVECSTNNEDNVDVNGTVITIYRNETDSKQEATITVNVTSIHSYKTASKTVYVSSAAHTNSDVTRTYAAPTFALSNVAKQSVSGSTATVTVDNLSQTYTTNFSDEPVADTTISFDIKATCAGIDSSNVKVNGKTITIVIPANDTFEEVSRKLSVSVTGAEGKTTSHSMNIEQNAETVKTATLSYTTAAAGATSASPKLTVTRTSNNKAIDSSLFKNIEYVLSNAENGVSVNSSTGVLSFGANSSTSIRTLGHVKVTLNISGLSGSVSAETDAKQSGKAPGALLYATKENKELPAAELTATGIADKSDELYPLLEELSLSNSTVLTVNSSDKYRGFYIVYPKTHTLSIMEGDEASNEKTLGTVVEDGVNKIWYIVNRGFLNNTYTFNFTTN